MPPFGLGKAGARSTITEASGSAWQRIGKG